MTSPPVILLGAARSGTKLLRGILAQHPLVAPVPYDVNYVWTLGQHRLGHDALDPRSLTPETKDFIRRFVGRFGTSVPGARIVEKTVSNTLRVPFVEAVFPEAQYVEIIRDGRDVAASAREQWTARPTGGALLTKLRTFPLRHAWRYGIDYATGHLARWRPGGARVSCWGPRYPGITADLEERPLLEVCALQWARCVTACRTDLEKIPAERILRVRYEDLVAEPVRVAKELQAFLDLPDDPRVGDYCRDDVSRDNVGKWRRQLDTDEATRVGEVIGSTLGEFGYGE